MDTISIAATVPARADRAPRSDGWTPDRQRGFLEAIAEGHTVDAACRRVGMAPSSAYALRRRAAGAAFALGWRAANLIARDAVADTLIARAIDGQVETITRPDGTTIARHRYDNRLAATMLARLDRFADAQAGDTTHYAARLIAAEFDDFLDLVERDAGPARTGLFLAARVDQGDPDLDTVRGLARADRFLRAGHGLAAEIQVADLDPDARKEWTADQWVRAEAAGLVAFTAPAAPAPGSPLSPLNPPEPTPDEPDSPVWWEPDTEQWRTRFPPPDGFDGEQDGHYGDPDYSRALDFEEEWLLDRTEEAERDALAAADAPERDAWFAAISGRPWPPAPIVPASPPAPLDADRDAPPPAAAAHGAIAAGYVDSHDPADPFSADFDPDFDPDSDPDDGGGDDSPYPSPRITAWGAAGPVAAASAPVAPPTAPAHPWP